MQLDENERRRKKKVSKEIKRRLAKGKMIFEGTKRTNHEDLSDTSRVHCKIIFNAYMRDSGNRNSSLGQLRASN